MNLISMFQKKDEASQANLTPMKKRSTSSLSPTITLSETSPTAGVSNQLRQRKKHGSPQCLPLSMQLLKYTPGTYCPEGCCTQSYHHNVTCELIQSSHNNEDDDWLLDDRSALAEDYDLPSLRRQNSAASPMVVAPMMMPNLTTVRNHAVVVERILVDYHAACNLYGSTLNAGVLTTFRFSLPCLRVSGSFHDNDMLALAEVLLKYTNGPLRFIKRLDFSVVDKINNKRGFASHGALALSKVLQKSQHIEEVLCPRNRIGPYGASALFIACSSNSTIQKLVLRRCRVGERGALAFCEWIVNSKCGLKEVDLSANYIGFKGSIAIEQALAERIKNEMGPLIVDLEGNLVFQEVMNGVTHGLGVILAFVGSWLLSSRVHSASTRHCLSCCVYSSSLVVLYVSSTLYHSFFTMQHTKYIFEVLDKCAIYILIAGSYTPFLQVVLWDEPLWSVYLLTFIWVCGLLGICVEAFFPTWDKKNLFSLAMYLGMGWSAVVCLPEVARRLPEGAMNLMLLGGVGYTVGVPFFVRNHNLDHAIWHLFVLVGSFFHWCGIYFYVATLP